MKNQEKTRITALKAQGHSYSEIAKITGLSIDTIKSMCLRGRNTKQVCRECGKVLRQTPGHRQKQFCNNTCRMLWWQKHPEAVAHKQNAHTCEYCGRIFYSIGTRPRRFCSRECYLRAVRRHG